METAIIFIIILAILIFVHELGHFLAAKAVGARVDKFAIGFPPRIFGKKIGETDYAINAIPFGGYVAIHGEQYDGDDKNDTDRLRSLAHKNRALQIVVFAAGVFMNVIFAWALLSVGFMAGLPSSVEGTRHVEYVKDATLMITGIQPGTPAESAGLRAGDEILFLGAGEDGITPKVPTDISSFVAPRSGEEIHFLVSRKGESRTVVVVPEEGIVPPDQSSGETSRAAVGIALDTVGTLTLPPHVALVEGSRATYVMTHEIIIGMKQFIWEALRGEANLESVSGPVGIANVVGDVRELGFSYLVTFTAFISINLAVLNLLPIPALDGGRILFVALEAVFRRRIPPKIAQSVNFAGFALLMLLMIIVTYRDIARLIAT